jgi:hypothetical protein
MRRLKSRRVLPGLLLLAAFAACALLAAGSSAQSGRRSRPSYPQPTPAATPAPENESGGESESESRPRTADLKDAALASFVVMESDDALFGADSFTKREVVESFAERLGRAPSVAVTSAGRGTRSDARRRAQGEATAYVVLVSLEQGQGGDPDIVRRRPDQSENYTLAVRIAAFEPKTGTLKYSDTVYQRPVRETARIGGVRIPVPTRTVSRYPAQLELRQAAHDAADRLLTRLGIRPPDDQP